MLNTVNCKLRKKREMSKKDLFLFTRRTLLHNEHWSRLDNYLSSSATRANIAEWTTSHTNYICKVEHLYEFWYVSSDRRYRWSPFRRRCTSIVWRPSDISCDGWGDAANWSFYCKCDKWTCCCLRSLRQALVCSSCTAPAPLRANDQECSRPRADSWCHVHHWRIPTEPLAEVPTGEGREEREKNVRWEHIRNKKLNVEEKS